MKNYPIIKVDLQLNTNNLKGKSESELKEYLKSDIVPLIYNILTYTSRDGDVHAECHADNHGNAGCSVGGSIHF